MPLKPLLDPAAAAANMAEIEPAYTPQQAKVEADRCLFCFDAPCITACPTGIDVPAFIKKIASDNLTGAGRTILEANVLGSSCARVCPTKELCEGACVLLDRDEQPIKIGRLQRHATDHVFNHSIDVLKPATKKSGKRVALIGAGPASIGCAAELVQLGHEAIVYEKKPQAGGLNTYGIAYYKLTPETSLEEVEMVRKLGVEFRCGIEVGCDISMEEILEKYDAVFLGLGLGKARSLDIPGEDLPEVFEALQFIEKFHTVPLHQVAVGLHAVIIGAGNTAIDAVSQSKRLGAESSTIVYRRGEDCMPAYDFEYDLAKNDGCEFVFNAAPVAILEDNGSVKGIRLIKTEIDADGRLAQVKGSEFEIPCHMVLKASGQTKQADLLKKLLPDLELDAAGRIQTDPKNGLTSIPKVYAGGDAANGGREVVNAVAEGKKAARGMHSLFTGDSIQGPVQPSRLGAIGSPMGSGFDKPVRVSELEAAYHKQSTEK